jgi:asparagine synthase (glutamine-hydrolysing)
MYFTLAVSAATRQACDALAEAAERTDPRVMPIPGPAQVTWRAPDGRAVLLHWGDADSPGRSHAGTIWAESATVHARTGLTRVDPVYLAEVAGAVVVSDRACWAAAVTERMGDPDPAMAAAFLSLGYPVGDATPFRGVRALGGDRTLRLADGRLASGYLAGAEDERLAGADRVAEALTEAVRPLGGTDAPVELSLTGGKDSRLVAAALAAARVPFRARTHGFDGHPDVVVAGLIADRLGVEHTVTRPRPPGAPDEADVLRRLRAAVLVSDGMLSAFENVGWPDPQSACGPAEAGGHGGELLRGGYAQAAWRTPAVSRAAAASLDAVAAAELFRRMTTRRLSLLRPGPARAYLASLAPQAAALARGPLAALDNFYLVNRAGRWSAAARQAYLLRSRLIQPLFADAVVRAARAVPLRDRMSDRLHRDVLGALCPDLLGLPLAGTPWRGEPRTAATVLTTPPGPAAADWRRDYGDAVAGFLRGYVLDHREAAPVFGVVRRSAAERLLRAPQADRHGVWALATLTALLSGDWLNAREPASQALLG